jgi:hypothetical protein
LSTQELCRKLTVVVPQWDEARWSRFLSTAAEDQALELQMLADSAEPPPANAWTVVLTILQDTLAVAGAVTGIAGAIGAVQSVIKGVT